MLYYIISVLNEKRGPSRSPEVSPEADIVNMFLISVLLGKITSFLKLFYMHLNLSLFLFFSLVCLSYLRLTCVPEFFVPVHGQDDEDVAQDVPHDGEYQHAGQRSGHSRRRARPAAALVPGQTVGTVLMLELQIHLPSQGSGHTWEGE